MKIKTDLWTRTNRNETFIKIIFFMMIITATNIIILTANKLYITATINTIPLLLLILSWISYIKHEKEVYNAKRN